MYTVPVGYVCMYVYVCVNGVVCHPCTVYNGLCHEHAKCKYPADNGSHVVQCTCLPGFEGNGTYCEGIA